MGYFQRKNHFPVEGRTVLLTGGSEGMGLAMGKLLASRGASVIIVARTIAKLESAVKEIQLAAIDQSKQRFHFISADLTSPTEATRILADATAWNNGEAPSIVINCAGASRPGYFLEIPTSILKEQMDVNYFAAAYIAHAVCKMWLAQPTVTNPDINRKPSIPESKHIVFTSSVAAFLPMAGYNPYTPAKSALRALSEGLSQELLLYESQIPIKTHCIYPATIFTAGLETENLTKPAITKQFEESDPGQTPEEVARVSLQCLERGEESIVTSGLLGKAMKAGSLGTSRRAGFGIFDTLLSWAVAIVLVFVRRDMDTKVRAYGKERRSIERLWQK